jgi:hypothetical protein
MSKTSPANRWREIKQRALGADAGILVSVLQDLYELSPENRRFLHARFMGAEAEREEFRQRIHEAIYPDPLSSRRVQVPEAVRMIRQYHRATGDDSRTIALLLYSLDIAVEQANDLGMYEEYFERLTTLVKTFLHHFAALPIKERPVVRSQFQRIVDRGKGIGYGFGDYLCEVLIELED